MKLSLKQPSSCHLITLEGDVFLFLLRISITLERALSLFALRIPITLERDLSLLHQEYQLLLEGISHYLCQEYHLVTAWRRKNFPFMMLKARKKAWRRHVKRGHIFRDLYFIKCISVCHKIRRCICVLFSLQIKSYVENAAFQVTIHSLR